MPTAPSSARTRRHDAAERLVAAAAKLVEEAELLRPGVAQLEAATVNGSVFVVRDGGRLIAATTTPEPTVGLVFYDLKTCLRSVEAPRRESAALPRRRRSRRPTMPPRKVVTGFLLAAGSIAGSVLVRRRAARKRERVDLYAEDGSMHSSPTTRRRRHGCSRSPASCSRRERPRARPRAARGGIPRGRLRAALREALALLPRQVPLRDAARPARPDRRRDRARPSPSTSPTRPGSPARSWAPSHSLPPPRWPVACRS